MAQMERAKASQIASAPARAAGSPSGLGAGPAGVGDQPLGQMIDLSYGWTKRGLTSNSQSMNMMCGDKSRVQAGDDSALATGSLAALAGLAFVAVARESLETVLFLFALGGVAVGRVPRPTLKLPSRRPKDRITVNVTG